MIEFSCDEIRPDYCFNPSCQGTVPEAIVAFGSTDFETAIRLAISLGGDSDTLACITGGIAEAFYGMSEDWKIEVLRRLPEVLSKLLKNFIKKYDCRISFFVHLRYSLLMKTYLYI